MKLCWLQAEILGGRFMQTSTRTPRKIIPKMFSRGFVSNEMYLMAGKILLKSDYQNSVKSKMSPNDFRSRKLLWLNSVYLSILYLLKVLSVNVSAVTDVGRGSLKQPAI